MKKMKKLFAMLLAFTMILGMTMTASAEETGKISIAYEGKLERNITSERLKDRIDSIINEKALVEVKNKKK